MQLFQSCPSMTEVPTSFFPQPSGMLSNLLVQGSFSGSEWESNREIRMHLCCWDASTVSVQKGPNVADVIFFFLQLICSETNSSLVKKYGCRSAYCSFLQTLH